MALLLVFDFYNSIIEVPAPDTSLDLQYLVNQVRDTEDELSPPMAYKKIIDAFGKQPLGGGTYVGITVMLLDNWKVRFEARPGPDTVSCLISGGNLVAESGNPIAPSAYTTVSLAQSSSPTIATPSSDYNLLYLVESLRGRHASIGNVYYWNPTSGSDSNDGTTPTKAVATFSKAQTLATAGNNDIIFALSTASGGITTVTEKLTISKATLKVRGSGYPFQFVPSTSGSATVTISGDSVELSGFYITTAAGGTDNGITVTGDNALIKDVWVKSATGNGIDVSSSARTRIDTCAIEDCAGKGINVGTSTSDLTIRQGIISGNGGDGVELAGATITDSVMENNLIYKNAGYGVDIASGVARTMVRLHHTFSGNTLGSTRDLGTDTFIETQAGGASASEIADAVWDEVIATHVTAGTAGKMLKDAKTKATLASLK